MSLFFLGLQTRRNCDQLQNIKTSWRACVRVCAFKSKGKTCYMRLAGRFTLFQKLKRFTSAWQRIKARAKASRHIQQRFPDMLQYAWRPEAAQSSHIHHWLVLYDSLAHVQELIPWSMIAQLWDYSHHIERLRLWGNLLVKTSLQGVRGWRPGLRGSWMVRLLSLQWKIAHFHVCCLLSLSRCWFVLCFMWFLFSEYFLWLLLVLVPGCFHFRV